MEKKWLTRVNLLMGALAILLMLLAIGIQWSRPNEILPPNVVKKPKILPKPAFDQGQAAYDAIGTPFLNLKFAPPSLQLPNLKQALVFYGKNERPDADKKAPLLHFAFIGDKTMFSAQVGEKKFLVYDRKLNPPRYRVSSENAPTDLWIQVKPEGANQVQVEVGMLGDNGQKIVKPLANAKFTLQEKDYVRFGGTPWEMGKWKVDATLLARQKARWQGQDMFFENYGGKEYSNFVGKQRIDFGEGAEAYPIFAVVNSCFIWKDDKWQEAAPKDDTKGFPLLCVKKIDARLMSLELWDVDGKGKTALNLLKSLEPNLNSMLVRNFKFIGARTLSQFVFDIDKKRMILRPQDWLLQTDKGWIKLENPKQIDDYVERRLVGPLFVFEGVVRKGDRQTVKGMLFNASRTQTLPIELPVVQSKNSNGGSAPEVSVPAQPSLAPLANPHLQKQPTTPSNLQYQNPLMPPNTDESDDEESDDEEEDETPVPPPSFRNPPPRPSAIPSNVQRNVQDKTTE